jgi:DNA-directed RNA polymerase subunit L
MHFSNYLQHARDGHRGRHSFEIEDVDLSIVNAIRRVALTDLPVIGFRGEATGAAEGPISLDGLAEANKPMSETSVEILDNNGPLHNEFMMHRIGMIPVCFSEQETDAWGTGAPNDPAAITFELDVANTGDKMLDVTTRDIRIVGADAKADTRTARLFPTDPVTGDAILITRLRENERLHFVARPVRSSAREHAGFSAVSQCTYTFVQDPVAADKAVGLLDKERAYRRNGYGDPTHIEFRMEVENAFSVRYVVRRALDILVDKMAAARQAIDAGDSTRVVHCPGADVPGYEFTFKKEDDTFGNLVQSLIHTEYMRGKRQASNSAAGPITYVGYFCPHPLDENVVVRVCMADEADVGAVVFMQQQLERIQRMLEDLRAEWIEFAPKA